MNEDREAFLAGLRPDSIHVFLHEDVVSNPGALEEYAESVADGIVMVLEGDRARTIFQQATGIDPMNLASEAMGTEGGVGPDCADGTCPKRDDGGTHDPQIIFSFAEAQNESVGGMYAKGPVIHAYVACTCGERYSDKWVVTAE